MPEQPEQKRLKRELRAQATEKLGIHVKQQNGPDRGNSQQSRKLNHK